MEFTLDVQEWIEKSTFLLGVIVLYKNRKNYKKMKSPLFFSLVLIYFFISILQIFYTKYQLDHHLHSELHQPFQFQKIFKRNGYYLNFEEQDNAYATRSGHIILGVKTSRGFWDRFFGKSGWTEDEKESLLNHEQGHVKMGLFFTYLESYILVLGLTMFEVQSLDQIAMVVKGVVEMKLSMIPLNLFSNWFDEIIADSNAGSKMLNFFDFVDSDLKMEGWMYQIFGGKDHPPIWLRRLFLMVPFNIRLVDVILVLTFFMSKDYKFSQMILIFSLMLWMSRIGLFQWYLQLPMILCIMYFNKD
jgi:hypothetical protein